MVFTFREKVEDPRVGFVMASQVGPLLCVEACLDHSTKIFGCVGKSADSLSFLFLYVLMYNSLHAGFQETRLNCFRR